MQRVVWTLSIVVASAGCRLVDAAQSDDDGRADAASADAAAIADGASMVDADTVPTTTLVAGDVRLVSANAQQTAAATRRWIAATGEWDQESPADTDGHMLWGISRFAPDGTDREILAMLDSNNHYTIVHASGGGWVTGFDYTATDDPAGQGIDVAFEASGEALAVYSDGTHTPVYRRWQDGAWTAAASLPLNDGAGPNPDLNQGSVEWVELAARPGADEITLAYSDTDGNLVCARWNGDDWVTNASTLLGQGVNANQVEAAIVNRAFDMAYEPATGDLLIAWAEATNVLWITRNGQTQGWSSIDVLPTSGRQHFVDLAAEPAGQRIAALTLDLGDGTERLNAGIWGGDAWTGFEEVDSQIADVNDTAVFAAPGAVGWYGSTVVAVYADNELGTIDWLTWSNAGPWQQRTDTAVPGKTATASVQLTPAGGGLMAAVSDTAGALYVATFTGSAWQLSNAGQPVGPTLPSIPGVGFAVSGRE